MGYLCHHGHWQGSHSRSPWFLLCHHGLLVPPWAPRHRVTMGYLCHNGHWQGSHSRSRWMDGSMDLSGLTGLSVLLGMHDLSRRLGATLAENLRICIFSSHLQMCSPCTVAETWCAKCKEPAAISDSYPPGGSTCSSRRIHHVCHNVQKALPSKMKRDARFKEWWSQCEEDEKNNILQDRNG